MKQIYFFTCLLIGFIIYIHFQQNCQFKTYDYLLSIGRDLGNRPLVSDKFDKKICRNWFCFDASAVGNCDSSVNRVTLDKGRMELIGKVFNEFTILTESSELSNDSLKINLVILKRNPIKLKFVLIKSNGSWIIDDIDNMEMVFQYIQFYKSKFS